MTGQEVSIFSLGFSIGVLVTIFAAMLGVVLHAIKKER